MSTSEQATPSIFDTLIGHYTDSAGLLGIVSDGSMRATNIRFLNDAQEYKLAFQEAVIILREYLDTETPHRNIIEDTIRDLPLSTRASSCFVISFSEHYDSLSQWRGYGGSGQAYFIGFNKERLASHAATLGWRLTPCTYDRGVHHWVTRQIVEPIMRELLEEAPGDGRIQKWGLHNAISFALETIAASFKHRGFREEAEVRLISPPIRYASPLVKYRPSHRGIIPYVDFPLPKVVTSLYSEAVPPVDEELLDVEQLILGPGRDEDSLGVAHAFMRASGVKLGNGSFGSSTPFVRSQ